MSPRPLASGNPPTFGLWYDFRQRLPFTEKYEDFYAECLEEIKENLYSSYDARLALLTMLKTMAEVSNM